MTKEAFMGIYALAIKTPENWKLHGSTTDFYPLDL